jgi:hypothetical protein
VFQGSSLFFFVFTVQLGFQVNFVVGYAMSFDAMGGLVFFLLQVCECYCELVMGVLFCRGYSCIYWAYTRCACVPWGGFLPVYFWALI